MRRASVGRGGSKAQTEARLWRTLVRSWGLGHPGEVGGMELGETGQRRGQAGCWGVGESDVLAFSMRKSRGFLLRTREKAVGQETCGAG